MDDETDMTEGELIDLFKNGTPASLVPPDAVRCSCGKGWIKGNIPGTSVGCPYCGETMTL